MLKSHQTVEQGKGFKSTKKKLSTGKTHMTAIKEEEESVTRNRDQIFERAKEFYAKLYSSDINNNSVVEDEEFNELSTTCTTLPVPEISPDEVEHTIHQLK